MVHENVNSLSNEEADTLISRSKSKPKSSFGLVSLKKCAKRRTIKPVTSGGKSKSSRVSHTGKVMHAKNLIVESPHRKAPIEYWLESLRKTGIGSLSSKMNTLSGIKMTNEKIFPYLSTSHYLRNAAGTEKAGRYEDHPVKPSSGRPAYRTPEEYYDEVLGLKKKILILNQDLSTMKTRYRRIEEENVRKEKEVENLLNPEQSEETRRTLGDRRSDSGALILSLRQKVLKLEVQLRRTESTYNKLRADMKVTKVDEMHVEIETLYQEVVRLQNTKLSPGTQTTSEKTMKVKALNETILRLNKSNESLKTENRCLKEDLDKMLHDAKCEPDLEKNYADMNRKELLLTISAFEERLENMVQKNEQSLPSGHSGLPAGHGLGKVMLKGSQQQRLTQHDQREMELLDEIRRQKLIIDRLSDSCGRRYKVSEKTSPPRSHRNVLEQISSPRSHSAGSSGQSSSADRQSALSLERSKKIKDFQQRHAASSIQRQWRCRRQFQEQQAVKVRNFAEDQAARKIQTGWLGYRHKKYDGEVEDAAYTLQAALSGHYARRKQMAQLDDDVDDDAESSLAEDSYDVALIQSSMRGHHARLDQLKHLRVQRQDDDYTYHSARPGKQRSHRLQEQPSSANRHERRLPTPSPYAPKNTLDTVLVGKNDDDDDDDDDIMF